MTISVCMIIKNEELTLSRILDCVTSFADEIIIIDTGSTDNSKHIAKLYTDKVYDFQWVDDFSKARNYSFSKATSKYVMWLDADDYITPKNQQKIIELKNNNDTKTDCYMLKYATGVVSKKIHNEKTEEEIFIPSLIYYRERIMKNDKSFVWADPVHEVIQPHGKIEYTDIEIEHRKLKPTQSDRNLKVYESYLSHNNILTPRQKFYYARELYYNKKYSKAIKTFNEFLKSNQGWLENKIEACLILNYCYLQQKKVEKATLSLIQSFSYDTPRAEIMVEISSNFLTQKKYKLASFWAKQCLTITPNYSSGAFVKLEAYNIFPLLNLVVSHFFMEEYKVAYEYNNQVLQLFPDNESALHNKKLLDTYLKKL